MFRDERRSKTDLRACYVGSDDSRANQQRSRTEPPRLIGSTPIRRHLHGNCALHLRQRNPVRRPCAPRYSRADCDQGAHPLDDLRRRSRTGPQNTVAIRDAVRYWWSVASTPRVSWTAYCEGHARTTNEYPVYPISSRLTHGLSVCIFPSSGSVPVTQPFMSSYRTTGCGLLTSRNTAP